MLRILLNNYKKVLTLLLIGFLLLGNVVQTNTSFADTVEHIKITVGEVTETTNKVEIPAWQQRDCDILIRVGEWGNETTVKKGKRVYIDNGVSWKRIPTDIPIRKDEQGRHFVSEFDINKKIATKVYEQLQAKGANVKLAVSTDRTTDLNSAGRNSNKLNPKLYLSLHTNSFKEDSSGYFFMYNPNDANGERIAQRLSDAMKDNGRIRQMKNRVNKDNYIGEMNVIHNSTIPVLGELGFFSGIEGNGDFYHIVSDEYANYVADKLSDELINIVDAYWSK